MPAIQADEVEAPPAAQARRGLLSQTLRVKLLRRDVQRALVNVGMILVLGLIVEAKTGLFFDASNLEAISVQIAVVTIVACPTTLIMVAGAIDISVAGTVALTGVVGGLLMVDGLPTVRVKI